MGATIKCNNEIKSKIKDILIEKLGKMMKDIRCDESDISVIETEDGLDVDFPTEEVYGYSYDYVMGLPDVFEELKEKYSDIAIDGLVCEYETTCAVVQGSRFYCSENDKALTVTNSWQECACCKEVFEDDVFYNSSQWDMEEGNLQCLCCPTCALEYCLSDIPYTAVEPNASFDEDETEDIYDSDDPDEAFSKALWKRIVENLDEYMSDFEENKERLLELSKQKGIPAGKKSVLMKILKEIGAIEGGSACENLSFVITGKTEIFKNRDAFTQYVLSQGGTVAGSISKKTNFLVNNDINSDSSKNKKAKELGISIITEAEFVEKFGK